MDLVVGRWTQRARVPGDPDRWRRRLEDLVRGPVSRSLAELPDPGGLTFLPRLRLRLRVPEAAGDDALVAAWTEGVRREVERRAAEAVWFPDRPSAERAALEAQLDDAPPWWVARALGGRVAAQVLRGWLDTEPARVPEALGAIGAGRPARLARLVHAVDAEALRIGIEAVWNGRRAPPVEGRAPDGVVAPAHLGLLLAADVRRAPVEDDREGAAAPPGLAPGARAAGSPEATSSAPGAAQRDGGLPRDGGALAPGPVGAPEAPVGVASPPGLTEGAPGPRRDAGVTAARPAEPSAGARGTTGPSAPAPGAAALPAARWPLGLGGLLLLLRPLSRHPWLADRPWSEWPAALAAVLDAVLDRALTGLAPAERDVVIDAHAALLSTFAVYWPPLVPSDPVDRDAADAVVRALLADLGPELREVPVRAGWVARLSPDPDAATLRRVLLRPARLSLSPTHADLFLPLDSVDVTLRRAGWDLDPGWLPGLRRVVRVHYEEG